MFLLFVTKPSRQDFDQQLPDILRAWIENSPASDNREAFPTIKNALSVSSTDYLIATRYQASADGTNITCWALLTRFVCGGVVTVSAEFYDPPPSR